MSSPYPPTPTRSRMPWILGGLGGCCVVTVMAGAVGLGGLAWLGSSAPVSQGSPAPAASPSAPGGTAPAAPLTVTFQGTEYVHRWSRGGLNEFTPTGQENLEAWEEMISIVVIEDVRDADQLAAQAASRLQFSRGNGKLLRNHDETGISGEPEHFSIAAYDNGKAVEAAFSRLLLFEGHGANVIYAKRMYGTNVGPAMTAWLEENGPAVETRLREWKGMPTLATLRALPQAAK